MPEHIRAAIFLSILLHAGFVFALCDIRPPDVNIKIEKPVVVDFVKLEDVRPEPVKPEIKIVETPKMDIAKKAEVKPAEPVAAAKPSENAPKVAPLDDAKKQAEIKSTKDYVNYYHLIREKIRKRLKSNYRTYLNEGEIALIFTLTSDGRLTDVSVAGAAADNYAPLADVATRSIREASPFPKFPEALSLPQMTFDLTVTFKKR